MAGKRPLKSAKAGASAASDGPLWGLLLLAVLAAHFPALKGDLLWDDADHITKPSMQSLHGLWSIWFDLGSTAQYYPLLHSAFWFEHRIWGDSVLFYHLLNLTLHALSAGLVVLIVRRLALPGEWLAGFLFALHPVCVEAVAWISEQKSTLSGAFVLASALAYLHFDRTRRKRTYWLSLSLFALALLSRTTAAMFPVTLLAILWWERGQLEWRRDWLPLLPWFAIGVPTGLFTAWVERKFIGAQGAEFTLTVQQRALLAGRALWFYASKLIWPANLTFSYPRWKLDPAVWWQWLFPVGVLALAAVLLIIARRHRGPLAAFVIFAGMLFPALGFFNLYPFRYSYVADHFQYLASLGIIVPVAALLWRGGGRIPIQHARIAVPLALVIFLGILTFRQSAMYTDAETLYRETLSRNPGSWLAHNNLGFMLVSVPGRLPEAIAEYREAVRIEPDYPEAHFNLGAALVRSQDPNVQAEAISEYRTALRLRPDYAEVHCNLGNALARVPGHMDDAISEFRTALRLQPDMAEAHLGMGNALVRVPGRMADAALEYRAALRINPDYVEAHFNLGNALLRIPGREPEAMAEYQAVLRLRPDLEAAKEMVQRLGAGSVPSP